VPFIIFWIHLPSGRYVILCRILYIRSGRWLFRSYAFSGRSLQTSDWQFRFQPMQSFQTDSVKHQFHWLYRFLLWGHQYRPFLWRIHFRQQWPCWCPFHQKKKITKHREKVENILLRAVCGKNGTSFSHAFFQRTQGFQGKCGDVEDFFQLPPI
jgi:hypothetical protein